MRITGPVVILFMAGALFAGGQQAQPVTQPLFQFQEVMVTVRDGIRLQTVILTPTNVSRPLPILFRRQKFVPNIYKAQASDFTPATQRIYSSAGMPSHVVLPVMP
jgi:predicted acyl esterase